MPQLDLLFLELSLSGGKIQARFRSRGATLPRDRLCAGPIKLAQRWLIAFATEIGSTPYHGDEGSLFMAALRSGRLTTEEDVAAAFSAAAAQVERMLAAESAPDDSADDTLAAATLEALTLAASEIIMRVTLTTQAASGVTVGVSAATSSE